ncbi:hypothetical protein NL676_008153 [Syzygium grande]|nr:hypothetical protein NL676_008153 [Syzygium grande]
MSVLCVGIDLSPNCPCLACPIGAHWAWLNNGQGDAGARVSAVSDKAQNRGQSRVCRKPERRRSWVAERELIRRGARRGVWSESSPSLARLRPKRHRAAKARALLGVWSGWLRSRVVGPGIGSRRAGGNTGGGAAPGSVHSGEATVAWVSSIGVWPRQVKRRER